MSRLARAVVPDLPHHVTQRGNRRQPTFFRPDDYHLYAALMSEWCHRYRVGISAYCLMRNHVHLIAVPTTPDGLRRAIGEAHRRYTREINQRQQWRGYLWQGRFSSFVMDERYTLAAARYIELNPVRARLVSRSEQYAWSSARAHVLGQRDALLSASLPLPSGSDWAVFLAEGVRPEAVKEFRRHERTGRPLGSDAFVSRLEGLLGRVLRPRKPGPRRAVEIVEPPATTHAANLAGEIVSQERRELRIVSPDLRISPDLLQDLPE